MGQPAFLENRKFRRRRIIGTMPGHLYSADLSEEFYCRPLDVSPFGLGVFTEDDLADKDDCFVLILEGRRIELQRIWTMENPGDRVGYRHGFRVKDEHIDLEQLCMENGYI